MSRIFPLILLFGVLTLGLAMSVPTPARAEDPNQGANRTFVEAVQNIRKANTTYDVRESVKLLRAADRQLRRIVSDYPESAIAVQLSTNQFVGDFDPVEFHNRIRSLSCERGSYVEEFLADYGIATTTGPQTEPCFLYRAESLLVPVETPGTPRTDWLALAAAYNLFGQPERAREIVLPTLSGIGRKPGAETQESALYLARVIDLSGEAASADRLAARVTDCGPRMNNFADLTRTALALGNTERAKALASNARDYAQDNQCNFQKPIAAQLLALTGRDAEARRIYDAAYADQFANAKDEERSETVSPDLAIAAAMVAEPQTALNLLTLTRDANSWAVPLALSALATRDDAQMAQDYADTLKDPEVKAAAYAALIKAAVDKGDRERANGLYGKFDGLRLSASQAPQQAVVLSYRARAERTLFKEDKWRATLQSALTLADNVDDSKKRDVAMALIAALAYTKYGASVLD